MRLLVVGAGSTGGYFGGRLMQAGRDVSFLVRPARAAALRAQGLRLVSPHGDALLQPTVVTAGGISAPYDVLLVTLKGFQLEAALDEMAPAIAPDTLILPVLNGMRHMDVLAARFSAHNLIGCVLKVSTVIEDDGRIVQLNRLQDLAYGELDGRVTPRIQLLDAFLKGADIGARLSTHITRELWEKWALLSSLGAITCLMRGTIGEVVASPGGTAFALSLLDEVLAITRAVGEPPSDAFVKSAREILTASGSGLASSMFRDVQRGRPVEVETIIGDLLGRATRAGLTAPLLSAAYTHLSVYQRHLDLTRKS
jgi:2-dehydropantoate 2-reductase